MNNLGKNSKKAAEIYADSKKEYQRLLKSEIRQQNGKKDVCRAAKAASRKYKKMTWGQALKKAQHHHPRQTSLKLK